MTDQTDFLKNKLNRISSSFCAAKWYESTVWIYLRKTASCHHTPHHLIKIDPTDSSSIHNTDQKIIERKSMLAGDRPIGCSTCWAVEDADGISDRILKSINTPGVNQLLTEWAKNKSSIPLKVNPKILEIAFSRACNMACSYCMPMFSSSWESDIAINGSYNLLTESRFNSVATNIILDGNNPVTEEFWKWWPNLETELEHLKITGGEPLMSSDFWKLTTLLESSQTFKGLVTVNTNLVQPISKMELLLGRLKSYKLVISTSIESSLQDAEYSRDGFVKETWLNNVYCVLSTNNVTIRLSTTINNLTVWTISEYFDLALSLKEKYGANRVHVNCNFVNFPSFMQIQLIPIALRKKMIIKIKEYILSPLILPHEKVQILRFITMLDLSEFSEKESRCSAAEAISDLKLFVFEFDKRRNKNHKLDLSTQFNSWFDTL